MKVIEINRKKTNTKSKAEVEEMIKKARKEYEIPVKGQFEFIGAEGGYFRFAERKFPGDPVSVIELIHGEICEMPMGIVKRLNGSKQKIRRYKDPEQTHTGAIKKPRTIETVARIKFTPVDYL